MFYRERSSQGIFCKAQGAKVCQGRFFSNQSLFLRARIADGEALSFLHASDLASLFGNALSNAIEYEQTVEEEKRCIFLKVFRKGDLVAVHIENYCTAELTFGGDLPLTTKHDKENHGFGLKSIRYTAERYNGSVAVGRSGNLFTPDVLFPAPRER